VLRRELQGKPLQPRGSWLIRQVAFALGYVLVCGTALFAAIVFLDGIWKTVALIPVLFFAEGVVEIPTMFRYGKYRREWELANGEGSEPGASPVQRSRA
jgi:hypothetical protein